MADPLQDDSSAVSAIDASGKSGANILGRQVELLTMTAILGMSMGCAMAAARIVLEAVFSFMPARSSKT